MRRSRLLSVGGAEHESNPNPTPNSVSRPARPRWRAVKEAVLDPAVEKLQDFTAYLAGVGESLDRHEIELRRLTQYVERRAERIMSRFSECAIDGRVRQALGELTDVVQTITEFVEEQRKINSPTTLLSALSEGEFRRNIVHLKEQLEDASKGLNDCLMSTIYLRSTEALDGQSSQSPTYLAPWAIRKSTRSSALTMTRLPKPTQHLAGRTALIDVNIVSSLTSYEPCRLPILGPGGIGKTTVASAVLNHQQVEVKFEGRRIFLNCEAMETAAGLYLALWKALRGSSADMATTYAAISQLEEVDGPTILVLDNLETSEQDAVEELLRDITDVANVSLLVTMRGMMRPLSSRWSQPLLPQLQPLLLNDSKLMYLSIAQCEDDGRLNELLGLLGGFMLAIELMANLGQQFTPTHLLEAYRRESTAILKRGSGDTRLTSIEVSIELSLKSPQMRADPNALDVLRSLVPFPAGICLHPLWRGHDLSRLSNKASAVRVLV